APDAYCVRGSCTGVYSIWRKSQFESKTDLPFPRMTGYSPAPFSISEKNQKRRPSHVLGKMAKLRRQRGVVIFDGLRGTTVRGHFPNRRFGRQRLRGGRVRQQRGRILGSEP